MKMKNILAAVAASAVSLTALASVSASAAEKTIAYNGASAGAYKVEGTDLRVNIFNEWGNEIRDIDNKVDVSEYINVNFTISGLNGQTTNKNTDGTDADSYYVFAGGAVGADGGLHTVDNFEAAGGTRVAITGDGTYDVKYPVNEPADSILCLYLQSNINVYNREGFSGDNDDPGSTGINIVVNSITTVEPEDPEETTTAAPEETTTAAPGETTTKAADGTTTTTAKGGATTTAAATTKAEEKAAATGDAGVGVALAAFGVAAGAAFVLRKKD